MNEIMRLLEQSHDFIFIPQRCFVEKFDVCKTCYTTVSYDYGAICPQFIIPNSSFFHVAFFLAEHAAAVFLHI
jgi:hypothetical protein